MANSDLNDTGKWDTNRNNYKCLRGCELWEDDEQLLDEDQRQDQPIPRIVDPPAFFGLPVPVAAPPPYNPPRYQAQYQPPAEFEWIYDDGMISKLLHKQ